jgi:hypothetical protein
MWSNCAVILYRKSEFRTFLCKSLVKEYPLSFVMSVVYMYPYIVSPLAPRGHELKLNCVRIHSGTHGVEMLCRSHMGRCDVPDAVARMTACCAAR